MTDPERAAQESALRDEALRLVSKAADRGILLRIMGSIAIELLSPEHVELLARLGRRTVRDIDFMAYGRDQVSLEEIFAEEDWTEDPVIRQSKEWGIGRLIYAHPSSGNKVDVFLDQLIMSHTIDMRGRLELGSPTISLADLLLSKLQIHEFTRNDMLDVTLLLGTHPFGDGQASTIEFGRLLSVTARDWGFERTISLNLTQVLATIQELDVAPAGLRATVAARVADLQAHMEGQSKSLQWRLRAAVGPRLQWYQDVDEVERGA